MCIQFLKSAFFLLHLTTANVLTVLKNLSLSCIKLLCRRLQITDPLFKSKYSQEILDLILSLMSAEVSRKRLFISFFCFLFRNVNK